MTTVTLKFTDAQLKDFFFVALGGDCEYWFELEKESGAKVASQKGQCFEEKVWNALLAGEELSICDSDEKNYLGKLSMPSVKNALQILADTEPKQFAYILHDGIDTESADCLLQCAVMGKVKYS